jgi:hypothetical protein
MKQSLHMKTRIISKMFVSLGLVLVLVSAITQVHGDSPASPHPQGDPPVVTIHSTGDVTRGETGLFILNMRRNLLGGIYISFSVSGTAIPGVDYVPLVSPAYIAGCGGNWCLGDVGVIPLKSLPDPRGSLFPRACDVVVTLIPGLGYIVGEPSSAQIVIEPLTHREIRSLPRPTPPPGPTP